MKVCTDACLLGAWASNRIKAYGFSNATILDIGTGTGLLSLMLAQDSQSYLTAIEISTDACFQAGENFRSSQWNNRITLENVSIQDFSSVKKYDIIISNPPFFENDLLAVDKGKNEAKHAATLRLDELAYYVKKHIASAGKAFILIPFKRLKYFESVCEANSLFFRELVSVKQTAGHNFFRCLVLISTTKADFVKTMELSIHDHHPNYTPSFRMLLEPFYLLL